MKCVFVASRFSFAVQYHALASIEANSSDWRRTLDELDDAFRLYGDSQRLYAADACAVFVPCRLTPAQADALVAEFNDQNPGVIPKRFAPR